MRESELWLCDEDLCWQEYERVGAVVKEDISEAPVILGVKSVPIDLLEPYKTYSFFSHTIKGQGANMPLLDAILEKVGKTFLTQYGYHHHNRQTCTQK